jgi:hypothetical protein
MWPVAGRKLSFVAGKYFHMLSEREINQFITEGYVCIKDAFNRQVAAACKELLWQATGYDPGDPSSWLQPVVRLGEMSQEPFQKAVNSPRLLEAFDQLLGAGKWVPRYSLGSFPLRFPHNDQPGDEGWHVDASFPGDDMHNYFKWRINLYSRGRGLLMLFLFSEVGIDDAPTRIRACSHIEVARLLAPHGEVGLSFMQLAQQLAVTDGLPEVLATGAPGTVYLCHPFTAHAAQAHRGKNPKFMAQPPLVIKEPLQLVRSDKDYNPVEKAIRLALNKPVKQ